MTACFLKISASTKKETQKVLSRDMTASYRLIIKERIKDHAGNKNAFMWLSPLVLELTASCYQGEYSKCANNSFVCNDGVSVNLMFHVSGF